MPEVLHRRTSGQKRSRDYSKMTEAKFTGFLLQRKFIQDKSIDKKVFLPINYIIWQLKKIV